MKKNVKYFLFLLFIIIVNGCKYNIQNKSNKNVTWIRFFWEGDSLGDKYYDKLAMFVPLKLEGIPYSFTFQLDLGAPSTMIYGNTFNPLLEKYPKFTEKLDTVNRTIVIQGRKVASFKNISFYLDSVLFNKRRIAYFDNFGEPTSLKDFEKEKPVHLGTIGADLFTNKVVIIDFKNNRFTILDSLNNSNKLNLVTLKMENNRIIIPIEINKKKYFVMYDTGSSFASLFLPTKNWNAFRDTTSVIDTIKVSAWGTEYSLFISKSKIEINLGSVVLSPEKIMANKLEPYYNFYKKAGIIGLMGNQMFYDKILLIDFMDKKFGLLSKEEMANVLQVN